MSGAIQTHDARIGVETAEHQCHSAVLVDVSYRFRARSSQVEIGSVVVVQDGKGRARNTLG